MRVSVVINTRNEERDLAYALRSVASWADEIIVADMASEDRTCEIARSFGAEVLPVPPAGFVEPARAVAVARATGDWILVLDADEIVPAPLSQRLIEIADGDLADIVTIPFRTFILGDVMDGAGWGPRHEAHPRFFRRGSLEFQTGIHSSPKAFPGSRSLDLRDEKGGPGLAIHHFNYLGVEDFVSRLNRYTSIEAQQRHTAGVEVSPRRALAGAGREFAWRYFRAGGFRRGWRGLYLSLLMAGYRMTVAAKQTQLRMAGDDESIGASYAQEAERLLSAYGSAGAKQRWGAA